jgi:hypothetical protein
MEKYLSLCPQLQILSIDQVDIDAFHALEFRPVPPIEGQLRTFMFSMASWDPDEDDEWVEYLQYLPNLVRAPLLEHLQILFSMRQDIEEPMANAYEFVLKVAFAGWPRIRSLKIVDDIWFSSGVCQNGIPPFQNLRHLWIPFACFVKAPLEWSKNRDISIWEKEGFTSVFTTLPTTLERLTHEDFSNDIVPVLVHLCDCMKLYPSLKTIEAKPPGDFKEYSYTVEGSSKEIGGPISIHVSDEIQVIQKQFGTLGVTLSVDMTSEQSNE